jgi:hypothetical protein
LKAHQVSEIASFNSIANLLCIGIHFFHLAEFKTHQIAKNICLLSETSTGI